MDDSRVAFKEFFDLPSDEKLKYCSGDYNKCKLYTSTILYEKEKTHLWKDAFKLNCTSLEECMQYCPDKPTTYREIVGEFVVKVNELGSRILALICEGLGLEPGYFAKEMSQEKALVVNYYPPCPNPSLTLGIGKHTDPGLLTILLLDHVPGLQVWKDPEWFGVEFIPDAFEVLISDQLMVASNGKVKSGEHRVVTNAKESRASAAFAISPTNDCIVEPAKALVNEENPPLFKPRKHEDSVRIKYNMITKS